MACETVSVSRNEIGKKLTTRSAQPLHRYASCCNGCSLRFRSFAAEVVPTLEKDCSSVSARTNKTLEFFRPERKTSDPLKQKSWKVPASGIWKYRYGWCFTSAWPNFNEDLGSRLLVCAPRVRQLGMEKGSCCERVPRIDACGRLWWCYHTWPSSSPEPRVMKQLPDGKARTHPQQNRRSPDLHRSA